MSIIKSYTYVKNTFYFGFASRTQNKMYFWFASLTHPAQTEIVFWVRFAHPTQKEKGVFKEEWGVAVAVAVVATILFKKGKKV